MTWNRQLRGTKRVFRFFKATLSGALKSIYGFHPEKQTSVKGRFSSQPTTMEISIPRCLR
jgi:hypothetical protein